MMDVYFKDTLVNNNKSDSQNEINDMRMLGIDYGKKRIGLALGDTETRLAGPLETIENTCGKSWLMILCEYLSKEKIEGIVIGIPRPLSDQTRETQQAQEIKNMIEEIKKITTLPIYEQNETWSSVEAARQAQELGDKKKRDDLAAAIILQSWLDTHT